MIIGLLFAELRGQIVWRSDYRVSEIGCLVEELGHSQIPYLDLVVFREEHVDGFDVAMKDLVRMQILDAQAHLDEEFPDVRFLKGLSHLLL